MRFIFALMLLVFSWSSKAGLVSFQEFKQLSLPQQALVIKAYQNFLHDYQKDELELYSSAQETSRFLGELISPAYAAEKMNCFYAGWPSQQVTVSVQGQKKTLCTSPANKNPDYQKLANSCGKNSLLCQPALFGKGLCVSTATRELRNLAFSQCEKKFKTSGRTLEYVASELVKADMQSVGDELFSYVHEICEKGKFQSKTPMCTNLKNKVAEIQEMVVKPKVSEPVANKIPVTPESESAAIPEMPAATPVKITEPNPELKPELVSTVKKLNEVQQATESIIVACPPEEIEDDKVLAPHEASEKINQEIKTSPDYCSGNQEGIQKETYSQSIHYDLENELAINLTYEKEPPLKIVGGYDIYAKRMGKPYSHYEDGKEILDENNRAIYPNRNYSYDFEGRGKENSFAIIDFPVKEIYAGEKIQERYHSTDLRMTEYTFFPRANIPSIKKRDDKVLMKLTTGEQLVIDAITGRITGGVAKEVPAKNEIETRGNKRMIYPDTDFNYQGGGLFIESRVTFSKDEKTPGSIIPVKALVDGKLQECQFKSEELWESASGHYLPEEHPHYSASAWKCTRLKFEKDEELYQMIRKKCPDFKFPKLIKYK
jgi:hypothetical protein